MLRLITAAASTWPPRSSRTVRMSTVLARQFREEERTMSTDARDTFRHWARRMLFHHHRMERSPEAASEVYQTSTMAALLDGIFREVTVAELLTHGDFKVGTFNHLDGEMVVLHGTCHHLRSDVNGMSGYVRTRTVMAQPPPYQPMTTVTADEPITEFRNMPGDLVGFRTPEF